MFFCFAIYIIATKESMMYWWKPSSIMSENMNRKPRALYKEYFYKYHLDANAQLSKIPRILALFINDEIDGNTPFFIVRKMVLDMLDKGKILLLADFINKKTEWMK